MLLIAGSGPSDRDWNSPGLAGTNGSGKLLAEALAGRGIAMLRYDKRGTGATRARPPHRWADFEAEQAGGLALLAGYPGIDPRRLYVVGHSEGALHALRLAGRGDLPIAGVGLLAAPGRPLAEIVAGQFERGYAAAQTDWPAAGRAAFAAMMAALASGGEAPVLPRGASPSLEALGQALFDSRERSFLAEIMGFEPLPAVRGLKLPLLVAGGLKDIQLETGADLDALIAAARASASPRVSTHRLARADHMLKREMRPRSQLGQPGRSPGYNRPGRSLDPAVPAAIEAWIAGAGEPGLSAGPPIAGRCGGGAGHEPFALEAAVALDGLPGAGVRPGEEGLAARVFDVPGEDGGSALTPEVRARQATSTAWAAGRSR